MSASRRTWDSVLSTPMATTIASSTQSVKNSTQKQFIVLENVKPEDTKRRETNGRATGRSLSSLGTLRSRRATH